MRFALKSRFWKKKIRETYRKEKGLEETRVNAQKNNIGTFCAAEMHFSDTFWHAYHFRNVLEIFRHKKLPWVKIFDVQNILNGCAPHIHLRFQDATCGVLRHMLLVALRISIFFIFWSGRGGGPGPAGHCTPPFVFRLLRNHRRHIDTEFFGDSKNLNFSRLFIDFSWN